jgi:hypothetical protein
VATAATIAVLAFPFKADLDAKFDRRAAQLDRLERKFERKFDELRSSSEISLVVSFLVQLVLVFGAGYLLRMGQN